ncbi:DEAD/DEAH box helicase family protein [Microbacterium sp. NPDC089180]|uniref:DEAD/DEAH box helicase family protein n=1 Tax=unclassified Microbacterium TaxID=2609290 RepID=UPI003415DADF
MTDWLPYDGDLTASIASTMDLRRPNAEALDELAKHVAHGDGREVIADLATGVGKTYLAAGLVDYLARQGVRNVLIVTPGSTILSKTIRNFTPGDAKYVAGAEVDPVLVTADNFARGEIGDALHNPRQFKLYVFNVQTLISPTQKVSRKARQDNETIGTALYTHLQNVDDLIVIVDEHHVIREKAERFNAAVRDLGARAVVGLTATPDAADVQAGKVVYQYSLADAIADRLVKIPVIVYRADGRKDLETQLADACLLRARKEPVWRQFAEAAQLVPVPPVLFVVCQNIADAKEIAELLTREDLLSGEGEVLLITSGSSDAALEALAKVEEPDSPVRAIVSVDKLKEGWDVKNIGVIVARRALASESLTEQVLGRGLRLPFSRRTDIGAIDQVDLVAHESYAELLRDKQALLQRFVTQAAGETKPTLDDGTLDLTSLMGGDVEDPATGFAVTATQITPPAGDTSLDGLGPAELLLAEEMGAVLAEANASVDALGQLMPRNPDFAPIQFPKEERIVTPMRFTLANVTELAVEQQGTIFRHDSPVKLVRRAINAERDLEGNVRVVDQAVQGEDATRQVATGKQVRSQLLGRLMGSGLVEAEMTEQARALELVDAFIRGAGIDGADDEWEWSLDHAARAEEALFGLIRVAYKARQLAPSYRWDPVTIPERRPKPTAPLGVWDAYRKDAWMGPWDRSIEQFARFDSETAELRLARKLDTWGDVSHWQRIYTNGIAWVPWSGGRYFPDFVVVASDGSTWVIEAKSDSAAEDSVSVTAKAEAAVAWIERVNAAKTWGTWHYLLATETQIAAAVDLRSLATSAGQ